MLIECTIPELDNLVTSGASTYHFRRMGDRSTPMLCDVVDTSHAADILSRPDFRRATVVEAGADADGDDADGDGDDAPPDSGDDQGGATEIPEQYAMDTLDDLREKFRLRFGRAAHPQAKFETLLGRLVQDDEAKAAGQGDSKSNDQQQ